MSSDTLVIDETTTNGDVITFCSECKHDDVHVRITHNAAIDLRHLERMTGIIWLTITSLVSCSNVVLPRISRMTIPNLELDVTHAEDAERIMLMPTTHQSLIEGFKLRVRGFLSSRWMKGLLKNLPNLKVLWIGSATLTGQLDGDSFVNTIVSTLGHPLCLRFRGCSLSTNDYLNLYTLQFKWAQIADAGAVVYDENGDVVDLEKKTTELFMRLEYERHNYP